MSKLETIKESVDYLRTYIEEGDLESAKDHVTDVYIRLENLRIEGDG